MKIALACDHGGYEFTMKLLTFLNARNHQTQHFGSYTDEPCDYPDVAIPAAISIIEGHNERGILVCTTGIGMCLAANKIPGIKAAIAYDDFTAKSCRAHNNTNILCLGAKRFKAEELLAFVEIWLKTEFDCGRNAADIYASRHMRRVSKIDAIDGIDLVVEADPQIDSLLASNQIKDFQAQIETLEQDCQKLFEQRKYWSDLENNANDKGKDALRIVFTKSMSYWQLDIVPEKSLTWSIDQKINKIESRINILQTLLSQARTKQRTT